MHSLKACLDRSSLRLRQKTLALVKNSHSFEAFLIPSWSSLESAPRPKMSNLHYVIKNRKKRLPSGHRHSKIKRDGHWATIKSTNYEKIKLRVGADDFAASRYNRLQTFGPAMSKEDITKTQHLPRVAQTV